MIQRLLLCCLLIAGPAVSKAPAADVSRTEPPVRAAGITVRVNEPGHKIAPTLWGIFFQCSA